jgi:hypothetical protein
MNVHLKLTATAAALCIAAFGANMVPGMARAESAEATVRALELKVLTGATHPYRSATYTTDVVPNQGPQAGQLVHRRVSPRSGCAITGHGGSVSAMPW